MSDSFESHRYGGQTCLVAHYDANDNSLPACLICFYCKQPIRPENMRDKCMGRVESDDLHISSTLTQKDFGIFGRGPEDKS